jgi:hypothetical protein
MKTFEEKFTGWLDGVLGGEELRSFENEHPSIQQARAEFLKLKRLMKENLPQRELENPDFFSSQLIDRINREQGAIGKRGGFQFLGLPRMAWAGFCVLSVGFGLCFTMIPKGQFSDPRANYVAEVLKTRTSDPKVKATVETQKNLTIIKLEGIDKLPPGQELRR